METGNAAADPSLFAKAAQEVKAKTKIAVLLPAYIPREENRLYATVERTGASGYSVQLAFVPNCNGAHACAYGHIAGSSNPIVQDEGGAQTMLVHRTPATFVPSRCAAYCNEASLVWKSNGVYYEVAFTAASLHQLKLIANSMRRY